MKRLAIHLLCLCAGCLAGQDVEQSYNDLKKNLREDPVKISGSIGASSVLYRAYGIAPRRDPFYWVLNANLSFSILNKATVPFSAVITQQDRNFSNGLDKFSQPFNQFGLSPRYKWLTVHAGYRTLEFSEYTLSGAMFLGGGVETNHDKSLVNGAAMYGRFVKAVPAGGVDGIVVSLPAYRRMGSGAKVRIGNNDHNGEIIFLKISDDKFSIPYDTVLNVTPQENEIIAIRSRQKITKKLSAGGEFAYSMFTGNLLEQPYKLERYDYINQFYSARPSSSFNKAITANADYTPGKFSLGVKYKRIDPDYRTMGAIFLTNDVEEISINTDFPALNNRLNLQFAGGGQRNNLDRIQFMTSKRLIGSCNITFNISPQLNISTNYSSFSSNAVPIRDAFSDSVKFVQLTQNGSLTGSYSFGAKVLHGISAVGNYQESGGNREPLTKFTNGTAGYNINLTAVQLSFNLGYMYNRMNLPVGGLNEGMGPQAGIQKTLFSGRLRLNINAGQQETFIDGQIINTNLSAFAGFNITINKNQSLRADCSYLKRSAKKPGAMEFSEIRGSLGYIYQFSAKPGKKQKDIPQ